MSYRFKDITTSHSGDAVIVIGKVCIGDSDGYLNQLAYTVFVM